MYGTLIASSTVGSGGASSIVFSSIPATYTDLFVILSARFSSLGNARLNLNSSGSAFSSRAMYSFATNAPLSYTDTVGLGRATSNSGDQTNNFGAMQLHLPNYRSSVSKPFSSDAFAANYNGGYIVLTGGVWADNSAITSLTLLPPASTTLLENTTAYLYGVLVGSGGATVSSA
jgi:hypothetical protein